MKRKAKATKRVTESAKPAAETQKLSPVTRPTPEEIVTQQGWARLTKFPEFDAKSVELRNADPNDQNFHTVIRIIHEFMWKDEWFANNTPYPFKVMYWS